MKNKKLLSALLCATLMGTCAYVGAPYITTSKEANTYGALELSASDSKDLSMYMKDTIIVNLPDDFSAADAIFGNTEDTVATYTEINDQSFTINALKEGTTEITLTDGNYNYTLHITVAGKYDTEIKVGSSDMSLTISDTSNLPTATRTISNFDALKDVKVVASAENIATATVDDKGVITVTGMDEGKIKVTVSAEGCQDQSFTVTVHNDVKNDVEVDSKIELSEDGPIKIYLDGKTSKTIYIENYDKLEEAVEGEMEDTDIASVEMMDNAFTIKAYEEGRTKLTLSCKGAEDKIVRVYVYETDEEDKDSDSDNVKDDTKITKIAIEDGDITLK